MPPHCARVAHRVVSEFEAADSAPYGSGKKTPLAYCVNARGREEGTTHT